jgi:hypothetical protein
MKTESQPDGAVLGVAENQKSENHRLLRVLLLESWIAM